MNKKRHPARNKQPKRLSAGVMVVRQTDNGLMFLLLRAFKHWDFPKGMVEKGEQPLEGARREVAEETGITELMFDWGEQYYDTPPYNRGKVARYYVARTTETRVQLLPNPETGKTEHAEYRWVSFEQAWKLTSPRVQKALSWVAQALNLDSDGQPLN
ncbi:MAG: NUDIX domain-containing protein [Gammaproteobacteria bacterium]|nr:NUDIX domain-containing protein [Gammaproteobacteria bacterium]